MSVFRKILDKLGFRREQPDIVGTSKFVPNDPRTAESDKRSAHAGMPSNAAPTSEKENKGNRSTLDKKGKRRGSD